MEIDTIMRALKEVVAMYLGKKKYMKHPPVQKYDNFTIICCGNVI